MDNNRKKPEVLAPASSLEVLKTAVYYGADAVYIGGEMYVSPPKRKRRGILCCQAYDKKVRWIFFSDTF